MKVFYLYNSPRAEKRDLKVSEMLVEKRSFAVLLQNTLHLSRYC